jgi:phosphate transport system substrate-binding protein
MDASHAKKTMGTSMPEFRPTSMFHRHLTALLLLSAAIITIPADAAGVRITGSGASFPYPIYSNWFKTYSRANDVIIDYQAKGSGAGIRDFINATVDFAGSDAAMTDAEIAEAPDGVYLLPITAGKIVIAYNLPGVDVPVRLARNVYPEIFLGRITRWNDPAIAAANPGISLPDLPITVVRRADSSGTTFAFTNHLAAISEAWRAGPGVGKTVVWNDSDKIVAAPKNDGVTATIMQTPGAIGYIEYGYARFAKVQMAMLENREGHFVIPDLASGQAALASIELPEDMRVWIPDPTGAASYPIVTYSWLLVKARYQDSEKRDTLRSLLNYVLTEGQQIADSMGYLPLPAATVDRVRTVASQIE